MDVEKKFNFDNIKRMSKSLRFTAKGYVRECESLFPVDNSYYNIPELITFLILLYLDEPEYFEVNNKQIYKHDGGYGFYHVFGKTRVDRKYYNKYQWIIETDGTFEGRVEIINDTNNAVSKSKQGIGLCRNNETVNVGSKQYHDSGSEWTEPCKQLNSFILPKDTVIITLDYMEDTVHLKSELSGKEYTTKLKEGIQVIRFFAEFLSRPSTLKLKSNI